MKDLIAKAKEEFNEKFWKAGTPSACTSREPYFVGFKKDFNALLESKLQEAYKAGQLSMLLEEKPIPDKTSGKMWLLYETGYNQAVTELHNKLNKDE